MELARQQCDRLGISIEVDPGDALIHAVWEAAGNVEFYRGLVAELPTHPSADPRHADDGDDNPYTDGARTGIYGPTYHQSGMPTGEAKADILVVLYNDERDRLANYAKAALAAGVEERRVRMAEADAKRLFGAVSQAMTKAELTPAQMESFRQELASALRNDQVKAPILGQ